MLTCHPKMLQAGKRIRVLVVDDSVVVRSLVTRALKDDPLIDVVGTAANGAIGLAKIPQLNPDVITLDIEMPEMNGLEALRKLRESYRDVVVIILSTLTSPGAAATIDALMLGANDYVCKPSNCGSLEGCVGALREELLPKIRQFFTTEPTALGATPEAKAPTPTRVVRGAPRPREVVAIGVSTGGPNALCALMPMFPNDFPHPVLIVQHMPPVFTNLLAERLQTFTSLRVAEATHGCTVEPGKVLIAPGDFHMAVKKTGTNHCVVLDQSTKRNSCRPSVDVLFESVNDVYGGAAIGAVLTGMGQDGLRGAEALRASGAYIIAQDEKTSVVWGMPGFVAKAGLADAVVPLDGVVPEILRQCKRVSHAAFPGAR